MNEKIKTLFRITQLSQNVVKLHCQKVTNAHNLRVTQFIFQIPYYSFTTKTSILNYYDIQMNQYLFVNLIQSSKWKYYP